jgi:hypothetical protein
MVLVKEVRRCDNRTVALRMGQEVMRWLSLHFSAECSHGLSDSILPILQCLVLLALAGCSAKDEAAAPSHTPTIVAQPTAVVSDLGARVSATLYPNGIDTDCYFEYGPTEAYGRRLTTKFIQAKLNYVDVSDTIAHLGVDTTYHCRLVATNAAGTTHSADIAFSVAKAPPTIMVETAVTVTGPKVVVFTATVNANNRSTGTNMYLDERLTLESVSP